MTIVFIENVHGSGQIVQVLEDFGGYVVSHKLQPGDNRRIAMSPFKSILVNEAYIDEAAQTCLRTKSRLRAVASA